jgi:hypothetical protein
LTKSEEQTMQAPVRRNEGVVGKWTDGLSRETGEAVVRDLLEFEGFGSHDNWMRQAGSVVAWLKDDRSAEDHHRKVIAHENVVPSPGPSARNPRRANALPGNSTDVARSNQLAVAWLRGSGRGECR